MSDTIGNGKEYDDKFEENNEENNEEDILEPESEIFTDEFMKRMEDAKRNNESAFQSYWEADENDIQSWSKKEIALDPSKKFISSAENGKLDDMKQLVDDISN